MSLTLADHRAALRIAHMLILAWPLVLTVGIAIVRRRRLRHPFAFIFLGYLSSWGIFFLVSQADAFSGWISTAASMPKDKLVAYLITHSIEATAASVIMCILPVLWLYRLLGTAGADKRGN